MASTLSRTINPQLVEVDFTNKYDFVQKYSNYLDLVANLKDELLAYFQYSTAFAQSDFVTPLQNFYTDLNGKYQKLDNEFLIYYIRKYNALADEIKNTIFSNHPQNFLSPISDSIGLLTNTDVMLNDSVLPFNDLNVTLYPAPHTFPVALKNKIRPSANSVAADLSLKTTKMFRNNIINIQFKSADSTQAHGSNLITDFHAYLRTREFALQLTQKISSDFGQLFKLVSYYSNINDYSGYNPGDLSMNLQVTADATYTLSVEGAVLELDLLGKQINEARKQMTIEQVFLLHEQNQTKPAPQPVAVAKNVNSTKPVPLNSTAPVNNVLKNNPLRPNIPTSTAMPGSTTPPMPVGITAQDRAKKVEPIKQATTTVQAKPDHDISSKVNLNTLKIPTIPPIFSTQTYANATSSPYAMFNSAKALICSLKNLDINKIINFKIPALPDIFKKPNFSKFKNPISALLLKAETMLIKKLLSLIPPLPDIAKLIANMKKQLEEALKKLFSCNPDNHN